MKCRLWHGRVDRAIRNLERLLAKLQGSRQVSQLSIARLHSLDVQLMTYICSNRGAIVDYGKRYRSGLRVATTLAESAVNSLVGKRMVKKQHMRWSLHGANMLMQVRTAKANGELGDRLRAPFRQPEANAPPLFKPKPRLLRAAYPCKITGLLGLARPPHDRSRAEPVGGQQYNRRAPDMLLRRIAVFGQTLKAEAVGDETSNVIPVCMTLNRTPTAGRNSKTDASVRRFPLERLNNLAIPTLDAADSDFNIFGFAARIPEKCPCTGGSGDVKKSGAAPQTLSGCPAEPQLANRRKLWGVTLIGNSWQPEGDLREQADCQQSG